MISSKEYYPELARQDYQEFLKLWGSNLPPTFSEWLKLIETDKLELQRLGFEIVPVSVCWQDFSQSCEEKSAHADLDSLKLFAIATGNWIFRR